MDDPNKIHRASHAVQESGLIALKAALSAIPVAGGPLAEVLGGIIDSMQRQRETQFLEGVLNGLHRRIDQLPETLGDNEAFKTALLRAMRIAAETHDEEILDALRNAVISVAIGDGPDDSLQTIFLDAMRGLTPWHMRLLACIADPVAWAESRHYWLAPSNTPDPESIFEAFYQGQLPAEEFTVQLLQDLYNRGLATNNIKPRTSPMLSGADDVQPRISDMGKKFLAFVTVPKMPKTTTEESQPA